MRVVPRTHAPSPGDEALLPSASLLEEARFLSERFPGSGLAEVPVVRAPALGGRVWLALESMQVTGSFKVRGAMFAIARRTEALRARPGARPDEPLSVVAVSAGNHGAGVAYAARQLGAQAEVVVPRGAPRTKVRKIASFGAKVVESSSPGYDGAEAEAKALARERGVPFLSPYDDVDVLVGNGASLAFEIVRALGRIPAAVYCPIGGGGLATGLACGLRHELASRPGELPGVVVPVQSQASCAFATSLERGEAVVELPPAETLAEGLEGGISERAFARARAVLDRVVVCTEAEIERAMAYAARELGLIVEGSAAVALVPALDPSFAPAPEGDTVILLTGRNVDTERIARVLASCAS